MAMAMAMAMVNSAWPDESVVATVDKQGISIAELEARTAAKTNAKQAEYESHARQLKLEFERDRQSYKERQLNALIDERVLTLEAKSGKTTAEALIASHKSPAVTEEQVRSFYDQQKTQINQPYEAVAPKIKEFLEKNARETVRRHYLDGLRTKYHVAVLLDPRREDVAAVGPSRGPSNAPVTIVEFSDFECPYCGRLEPVMARVLAKYPTQVRLVYRNFPLKDLHPDAQKAAEAGMCAQQQGKFWEIHDLMFAEQASLNVNALKDKARRIGLDMTSFNDCLDSGKSSDAIATDVKAGDELGIQGTPANFINGRYLSGAVEESDLTAVIEDELRRVGLTARR
jgi:protein-disulfide isomerase